MAEIELEEALEELGEAEEGLEEAAEVEEEMEVELEEAREGVQEIRTNADYFKNVLKTIGKPLRAFTVFAVKTSAMGAILFGVNYVLGKLINDHKTGKKEKEQAKRKLDIVKAISHLIKTETTLSKGLADWMKKHKDITIELDGIEIPLESIFVKYLKPIDDAVTKAYEIAKTLQRKIDGNISWEVPTIDNISQLIDVADQYIKAFTDLQKFCSDNVSKVPELKSVPLTDDMISDLKSQLKTIKDMPLY